MQVFTIGHSLWQTDVFNLMLEENKIEKIWDVRSNPYSKYAPQFNLGSMGSWLKCGIEYVHVGDKLGGKPSNPDLYTDGRVDYDLVAKSKGFISALDILSGEIDSGKTIVVMCSEKDPLLCHRFVLISRLLKRRGYGIMHILKSTSRPPNTPSTESQADLERRMLHHQPQAGLFLSPEEALELTYDAQGRKIAYRLKKGST